MIDELISTRLYESSYNDTSSLQFVILCHVFVIDSRYFITYLYMALNHTNIAFDMTTKHVSFKTQYRE